MTGFKPGTSGVKSNCSTHCATTTAQKELVYYLTVKLFCFILKYTIDRKTFANDWIQTRYLRCQKQLLYSLRHHHCPKGAFYALTAKPFCRSNIAQQLQNIFQLFSEEDPEEPTGPSGHQIQTTTTQEPSQVCKNLNSKKLDCLLPQRATK